MSDAPPDPLGLEDEDQLDEGQEHEVPQNGDVPEAQSLLSQLGEIRQEIKEEADPLDLPVPGYKDKLYMRCRPFAIARTETKVQQVQRAVQKKKPFILGASCDTIVEATEQLMLKGEDGVLKPIDESLPVTFNQRLLGLLHVPNAEVITTARQVVLAIFPTEQSILKTATEINEWLNGELDQEADEEFLGNSRGTTRS